MAGDNYALRPGIVPVIDDLGTWGLDREDEGFAGSCYLRSCNFIRGTPTALPWRTRICRWHMPDPHTPQPSGKHVQLEPFLDETQFSVTGAALSMVAKVLACGTSPPEQILSRHVCPSQRALTSCFSRLMRAVRQMKTRKFVILAQDYHVRWALHTTVQTGRTTLPFELPGWLD